MTCLGCRLKSDLLGVVTVGHYSSSGIRRGVHWLKFKGVIDTAEPLAQLLIPRLMVINTLKELGEKSVLVPVPLHKRKLNKRGFNQSKKIAEAISHYTRIPIFEGLQRTKPTWTQTSLPADLRKENLADSFSLEDNWPANRKTCLLVDDVVTTGATLSEAAKPLVKIGVKEIWGVAVARG